MDNKNVFCEKMALLLEASRDLFTTKTVMFNKTGYYINKVYVENVRKLVDNFCGLSDLQENRIEELESQIEKLENRIEKLENKIKEYVDNK